MTGWGVWRQSSLAGYFSGESAKQSKEAALTLVLPASFSPPETAGDDGVDIDSSKGVHKVDDGMTLIAENNFDGSEVAPLIPAFSPLCTSA